MSLSHGVRLGPYEVLGLLGAGGMGEVYRARDTRLGREVAIKVLPGDRAERADLRERFEREARAISALSHRGICTLHDVGEHEGLHYLVMELLEGETLAHRLTRGPLPPQDALAIAVEIAEALAAAHRRGIVHRDLKPSNVMLTRSGVKLLDFGLAKLHAASHGIADLHEQPTAAEPLTGRGELLGTLNYMAPEQLNGGEADERSDIFALGCVLYEMIAGRRPFAGGTQASAIAAILHDRPVPLGELQPLVPVALDRLVQACLAKDPEQRWYSAADLARELRWAAEQPAPGAGRAPGGGWRSVLRWALAAVASFAAIAVTVIVAVRPQRHRPGLPVSLKPLTVGPGYEGEPTFAPDGTVIAYVSDRTGNLEIYLKQVDGGPDINLTNDPADDVQPAFSPDGTQIAFVSTRSSATDLIYRTPRLPLMGGDVWVMPALGGRPRKIAEGGNFPSWTPDGSGIVFIGGPAFDSKVLEVPQLGGTPHEIAIEFEPDEPASQFLVNPTLSPDGRWLAVASPQFIYVAASGGGRARRLVRGGQPVWSPDGKSIIYCNGEPGTGESLWRIPFNPGAGTAEGGPEPLTVGRGRDTQATVSRDGRRIVFAAQDVAAELQEIPFDPEAGLPRGEARTLAAGRQLISFLCPSPDGRAVVFEALRGDGTRIWRVDVGSRPVALTTDPRYIEASPRWSPDGSTIAFIRTPLAPPGSSAELWLIGPDGSDPRKLVANAGRPVWLPDGRSLLFWHDGSLSRVDVSTGAVTRLELGQLPMRVFTVSPDGAWVAFQSNAKGDVDILAAPVGGGTVREVAASARHDYHPFFSPSGRWLFFQQDHKNIFRVPGPAQGWRKAPPEKVTHFPESNLYLEDPQLSGDGRWLALSRITFASTLWLLTLPQ